MAGYRQTLKKLAKKYGVDIKGLTYTQLIQDIIIDNSLRATKKMHQLSDRRMRNAFDESVNMGIINLPEYAVPAVTAHKAAQSGKMITDTMRNSITRGLRQSIIEHPNDAEAAIMQMQQHIKDTFSTYTTAHAKTIAVTEVRSAVDMTKYLYAQELAERNQGKLHIMKQWVHNDSLVKDPRENHKAIDGEKVAFGSPFSIGLMYPHDPAAPASEVINCQCGYKLLVEEMATNEIFKDILRVKMGRVAKGAAINPSTGKPYQIGDIKTRPDGTKWVKTGTFSWALADKQDSGQSEQKKEEGGQSAQDAKDIAQKYGNKGLYRLTRGGLLALLEDSGVENPKSLSWKDKVAKYQEIVSKIQQEPKEEHVVKPKTEGKQELIKADFHILHNKNFIPPKDPMVLGTHIEFNDDGSITDKSYDELVAKIEPRRGGHWGDATTKNDVATAVALVNAPDWKPIDKMENGQLVEYTQDLSSWGYATKIKDGLGLRKYAQEHLKHPDMSREKIPNFFRGMTLSREQFNQLVSGEADTIELTGCTAISSYEEIADQYSGSSWTRRYGSTRQSVKLIIERDDYLDNSIGMFHPCGTDRLDKNPNRAFEMLTGASSFYVKSVGSQGARKEEYGKMFRQEQDWDNIKQLTNDDIVSKDHPSYYVQRNRQEQAKAKLRMREYIDDTFEWTKKFIQDHADDIYRRYPKNKNKIYDELTSEMLEEFSKTPMGKKWAETRGSERSGKLPHVGASIADQEQLEHIDEGFAESQDYFDMLVFEKPTDLLDRYLRQGIDYDIAFYNASNLDATSIAPPKVSDYFSQKNVDKQIKSLQKQREKFTRKQDIIENVLPKKAKEILGGFLDKYDIPQDVKDEYVSTYSNPQSDWQKRQDIADKVKSCLGEDDQHQLYRLRPPTISNGGAVYVMGDWKDSPYYTEGIDDIVNKQGAYGRLKTKVNDIDKQMESWKNVPIDELSKMSDEEFEKELSNTGSDKLKDLGWSLVNDYKSAVDSYYKKLPAVEIRVVAGRGKKSIKSDDTGGALEGNGE